MSILRRFKVLARPLPAFGWLVMLVNLALGYLNFDSARTFYLQHQTGFALWWGRINSPTGRAVVYVIGVVWIVCAVVIERSLHPLGSGDSLSGVAASKKTKANAIISAVNNGHVEIDPHNDFWVANSDGSEAALVAITIEPRKKGENVGGYIKATAIFRDMQKHECFRVNPCWIDEPYAAREFHVGDTHRLVIACRIKGELVATHNRRRSVDNYNVDTTQIIPLIGLPSWIVEVQLVDEDNGHLLLKKGFVLTARTLKLTPV
jgi:hypothetical protein